MLTHSERSFPLTESLINGPSKIIYFIDFSTWQADNHRHMFRLSDSKINLEFPSGQPLVSSPVHIQLISAILSLIAIQELLYSYLCIWMYFKEITRRRFYFYWNVFRQQQRMAWSVKQVYSPLSKPLWNISINSTKRTDVPCNWHWEMGQELLDTAIIIIDTKYQALLPLSRRNERDLMMTTVVVCHMIST